MATNKCKEPSTSAYLDVPFSMIPFEDECPSRPQETTPKGKKRHEGTPVCEAILNLLSDILGSGLLALPYVVSQGGISALVSILVIPIICYYTGQILIDCLYEKSYNGVRYRVRHSYKEIGEACWPGYGGIITVVIQGVKLFLSAASYIVLSAALISSMLQDLGFGDRLWILIAALVGLPMILAKNLSQVAWLSLLSIAALLAAVVVVSGYGYSQSRPWELTVLPVASLAGTPFAISVVTFSYVAHGILPTIEENMTDRTRFNSMLAITYAFCAVLRTFFAINGFFSFYGNIHPVISNSLPANSAIHVTVNALLVAYSILCYPFLAVAAIQITERSIIPKCTFERIPSKVWYVCARVLITVITVAIALLVPHFAALIAISGNLGAMTALIFPTLFHLRLKYEELSVWDIILDFFVLVLGIAMFVIGSAIGIRQLLK
ncbi:vesicular inhibitory amino acid transporter [Nematostella vectensis]|uniref:vesicular inhibitory amino acid transporter n=1 Tax=Nematostella vectensis TaxID=45351 RepID=UPI0020777498|nr:vesicular inhibitory amino acid transporter [Nematostella vectensis]XP_048586742.1 vesicular inhibitory amino acid transporter [Nematostella vectensis]